MKVLVVCSGTRGFLSPFIRDQIDALTKTGIEISLFQINKKRLSGYLWHLRSLKRAIKLFNPDLVHAHYGLSGLLANLQRSVPVVSTFHGSDINEPDVFKYSIWAYRLSAATIFVEESMLQKVKNHEKSVIIPCGVDTSLFYPVSDKEIPDNPGINSKSLNILFSSAFDNEVKNYSLAKESCKRAEKVIGKAINLIELKGYGRDQVNRLMNISDCVLLTSFSEGSPQFIKEAMACNCPIVTTNVGDVKWVLGNTEGCYITSFDPDDVAEKIKLAIEFREKHKYTNGRSRIIELGLDSETIAGRVIGVYRTVLRGEE